MIINSHLDNIYEKLREHLDRLPIGFSKTESGVEIDILKKIFELEEADMAIHLQPEPETVEGFCQRTVLKGMNLGWYLCIIVIFMEVKDSISHPPQRLSGFLEALGRKCKALVNYAKQPAQQIH